MTIWIDASSGASGDMLLGALVGAGVPVDVLQGAVDAIAPEPVVLRVEQVSRNGFAATRCHVEIADSVAPHLARHPGPARRRTSTTTYVTSPRGRSNDSPRPRPPCTAATRSTCTSTRSGHWTRSPMSSGSAPVSCTSVSTSSTDEGGGPTGGRRSPPSPSARGPSGARTARCRSRPAVAELLRGVPSYAGPPGAAHGAVHADRGRPARHARHRLGAAAFRSRPPRSASARAAATPRATRTCCGCWSGRSRQARPPVAHWHRPPHLAPAAPPLLIETNVDDLDPRVWPAVIAALLEAGASTPGSRRS